MALDEERPSRRQWAWAIGPHSLTAAVLWWLVVASWFNWLTVLLLLLAFFSTGLLIAPLSALAKQSNRNL